MNVHWPNTLLLNTVRIWSIFLTGTLGNGSINIQLFDQSSFHLIPFVWNNKPNKMNQDQ